MITRVCLKKGGTTTWFLDSTININLARRNILKSLGFTSKNEYKNTKTSERVQVG